LIQQDHEQIAVSEQKLGFQMVREKLLTEAQMKTALDFQRTVGGSLDSVLLRLQFVDSNTMKRALAKFVESNPSHVSEEDRNEPPDSQTTSSEPATREVRVAEQGAVATAEEPLPEATTRTHDSLILDAMLKLLIRKGVITSEELKEELNNLDTSTY
jgi:hypothetical protein